MHAATQLVNLRIWRDEQVEELWRVSYDEGDGDVQVAFPDTAALGDFLAERLGLNLNDERREHVLGDHARTCLCDHTVEAEMIKRAS
jgi:hypothetical protein